MSQDDEFNERVGRTHLKSRDQYAYLTWGARQSTDITAAGEAIALPVGPQLVEAHYERPTSWTLNLLVDGSQGAWIAADVWRVTWSVRVSVGSESNFFPIFQTFTYPGPGGPAVVLLSQQVAAHAIQVVPFSVSVDTQNANRRTLAWSAWTAPLVY